ncbi:MAG: hypothetical protein HFG34_00515 [Eubacterium sp.]|nr:hypothetical protein [Eubacterium sp.]
MSERERAIQLLEALPDNKIAYVIGYIQGLTMEKEDEPNEETISAFKEGDEMLANGTGKRFNNLDDLWDSLEA